MGPDPVWRKARSRGETFASSDFWLAFGESLFDNWQSEWGQLILQGVVHWAQARVVPRGRLGP